MIERHPYLALALPTLAGIGIIIALYISLNDPGPPPETEEERFGRIHTVFIEAFAGGAAWSGRIEPLGLQSSRTAAHSPGWQISGNSGACDNSGHYIIRDKPASALAITTPHSQSDVHTGSLAQMLFDDLNARGAAWNTTARDASEECGSGLDLTGAPLHPFSAFALAFAESHSDGVVFQLHGIEESSNRADVEGEVALILSTAQAGDSPLLSKLAGCLWPVTAPYKVLVAESGLSRAENAQAHVIRQNGFSDFVQIELSMELREAMLVDRQLRTAIGGCLTSARGNQI